MVRTGPRPIDFPIIARTALVHLPALASRWLPDGHRQGREWIAKNPTRPDRRTGSFKVNLRTGRWADFATGDRGGDAISLAAYLFGLSQAEAARRVAEMLGLPMQGKR
jgi:hypothetical protein